MSTFVSFFTALQRLGTDKCWEDRKRVLTPFLRICVFPHWWPPTLVSNTTLDSHACVKLCWLATTGASGLAVVENQAPREWSCPWKRCSHLEGIGRGRCFVCTVDAFDNSKVYLSFDSSFTRVSVSVWRPEISGIGVLQRYHIQTYIHLWHIQDSTMLVWLTFSSSSSWNVCPRTMSECDVSRPGLVGSHLHV